MNKHEFLALKLSGLGGDVGVPVALQVVLHSREAEVALCVDGVIVNPVGHRSNSQTTLEGIGGILRQDVQGNET